MFVGAFFSKTNQRERHIQSFVSDKFNNLTSIVFFRFTHARTHFPIYQWTNHRSIASIAQNVWPQIGKLQQLKNLLIGFPVMKLWICC